MDFATLYDEDIETWAELQVAALRRLAARPGPWANVIDWENVIEEIDDLGSEKRESVESLVENALTHLIKILADPTSLSVVHWRREARSFLFQARAKAKRSMRSRIDMDDIWRKSVSGAANALEAYDRALPLGLADRSPFSFDELLGEDLDPDGLLDDMAHRAFK
jgi:hypothetical protein